MSSGSIVAVDFDGTLVEHRFPDIGPDVPDAFEWCRRWISSGIQLILWTVRFDTFERRYLSEAVQHCRDRGVEFLGVNHNPTQEWSRSPKAYAHYYVDDSAVGTPLILDSSPRKPYVDWSMVGPMLLPSHLEVGDDDDDPTYGDR